MLLRSIWVLISLSGLLATGRPLPAQPLLQEPPLAPRVMTLKVEAKEAKDAYLELARLTSLGHATKRGEGPRLSTAEALVRLGAVKGCESDDLRKAGEAARKEFVARFKHCWAHQELGNTPDAPLKEFGKVARKAALPWMRDDERAEAAVEQAAEFLGRTLARGGFSRRLEYAQIQSIDRQQALWPKYLLPEAKKHAGAAAADPPLAFDPKAKPLRFRVYTVYDLPFANKSGKKLTQVTLRLRAVNEFGDKHDMYYFLPEIREGETVHLEWSPWWAHMAKAVCRKVDLTLDVWAAELSHAGYEYRIESRAQKPGPEVGQPGETFEAARARIVKSTKEDFKAAEELATWVDRYLPDPVDPVEHRKKLLAALQPDTTYEGKFALARFHLKVTKLLPEKNQVEAEMVNLDVEGERFRLVGKLGMETNFATTAVLKGNVSVTLAGVNVSKSKAVKSTFPIDYVVRVAPGGAVWLNILDSEVAVTRLRLAGKDDGEKK